MTAWSLWDGHRAYDWLAHLPDEDPSVTAAYAWLASQPKSAVLEMPVVTDFQAQRPVAGASVTLRYQLGALRHGHRLLNGSSGFVTPFMTLLQSPASPFTAPETAHDALRIVRAVGARYVVMHRHEYRPEVLEHVDTVQHVLRADQAQVEAVREFGRTVVLVLRPAAAASAPSPPAQLDRDGYEVAASHNGDVVHQVSDGSLDTRWLAPQHGHTWIDVQLSHPRTVQGVKLAMSRVGMADYPQHLRIVGTDASGADHVLYDRSPVYDAAMTAVREPAEPGVRIGWAPIALSSVRLEQPVHAGDRPWAIHELYVMGQGE